LPKAGAAGPSASCEISKPLRQFLTWGSSYGFQDLRQVTRYLAVISNDRFKKFGGRLIAFDTIRGFLDVIALHACDANVVTAEYVETRVCIDRALTRALWQTQHIMQSDLDGTDYGELELRLEGSAAWYLERREGLRRQQAAA
jgi:hypothetical protein